MVNKETLDRYYRKGWRVILANMVAGLACAAVSIPIMVIAALLMGLTMSIGGEETVANSVSGAIIFGAVYIAALLTVYPIVCGWVFDKLGFKIRAK